MAVERRRFRTWDDYFIPGTIVLRNKLGINDPDLLREAEEGVTAIRIAELFTTPIDGNFDYDHMKAIHFHIFQDVYEWAGQERVAPEGFMTKDGHSYYPAGEALTAAAHEQYRLIAQANYLRGLSKREFVTELAERWGEINVIHSFREGNTRTQFVFFHQLSGQAGYHLDTTAFAPGNPLRDKFIQARFHSQDTGSNQQLMVVLAKAISHPTPPLNTFTDHTHRHQPSQHRNNGISL